MFIYDEMEGKRREMKVFPSYLSNYAEIETLTKSINQIFPISYPLNLIPRILLSKQVILSTFKFFPPFLSIFFHPNTLNFAAVPLCFLTWLWTLLEQLFSSLTCHWKKLSFLSCFFFSQNYVFVCELQERHSTWSLVISKL